MSTSAEYTVNEIFQSLGYPDPMTAARQQARMILIGRLARYQTAIQQFEHAWGKSLADLRQEYEAQGREEFTTDDAYLEWQWYADAVAAIEEQLTILATD